MAVETEKVYIRASLGNYSLPQRIAIAAADRTFYFLIKFVGGTTRFEIRGAEHLNAIETSSRPKIYAVWHDRIFLGTYFLKGQGIVFLTSRSFDGEYIARFLQRFGFGVIRGSSTRGGTRALVEMIRGMKNGLSMGFTVDGPKGPRYQVKPGVAALARKTGCPILPFVITPKSYFTLNSWDRLQIPRPFSRALVQFGRPIGAPGGEVSLESVSNELQNELDRLVMEGEVWRTKR